MITKKCLITSKVNSSGIEEVLRECQTSLSSLAEPHSLVLIEQVLRSLQDPRCHLHLQVLLPLCILLEREIRVSMLTSTTWPELAAWLTKLKKKSPMCLRKEYETRIGELNLERYPSEYSLRNIRFYMGSRKPKKFLPSISDAVVLIILDSPLARSLHYLSPDKLNQWMVALVGIQRIRNICTHGPLDEIEDLSEFISEWCLCFKQTLQWKEHNCSQYFIFDEVESDAA